MENQVLIFGMFPGQGSQKVGMGKELAEQHELAKSLFSQADTALGFELSKICWEGPEEELTLTKFTQPAILTVSTICYRLAKDALGDRLTLSAAAGHSLGEYSALVAANAISFEDAVQLVHKRGSYMQEAVPEGTGKMLAVLGKETSDIEAALKEVRAGVAEIANVNSPGQVVVAGSAEGVDQFSEIIGDCKKVELQVSAPFHCALMKPAADALAKDLDALTITTPEFPVYANYYGKALSDPEEIREALKLQVCGTVRWVDCVQSAVEEHGVTLAVEFGQGVVLSGLIKRINSSVPRLNIDSVEKIEKLAEILP